jgi:hypothetical protein
MSVCVTKLPYFSQISTEGLYRKLLSVNASSSVSHSILDGVDDSYPCFVLTGTCETDCRRFSCNAGLELYVW